MNDINLSPSETYKIAMIDKRYVFAGYACPICCARYGEPQQGGWIDIIRCEKCKKKKDREN